MAALKRRPAGAGDQPPSTADRCGAPDPAEAGPTVHLNLRVRGLAPSATMAINERSNRLRSAGRQVYKLGFGQSPFPVPAPVVAALAGHASEKDYLPVAGLPELRAAVASHYGDRCGVERQPDDVLVGPGSKELMFLLQLVYYGDLLVPTPAWVSYAPQARIIGRPVRLLPTLASDEWRLTAAALDVHCRSDPQRPRLLVLNYPSNPTGTSYGADQLAELADVARRYRLIVLADEIYAKLSHSGEQPSIAAHYPEGTILSSGLSKWCGAGGWRLGLFVLPPGLAWLRRAMVAVASETFTSTSAPIQHAAVAAFAESPEIERYLMDARRILAALAAALVKRLRRAGVELATPAGGFYLFPDLTGRRAALQRRGIATSAELCERLLEETGVATLPGSVFGRPVDELTLRLAYVNFDGAAALVDAAAQPAAALDDGFLGRRCGETIAAVECICDWLG